MISRPQVRRKGEGNVLGGPPSLQPSDVSLRPPPAAGETSPIPAGAFQIPCRKSPGTVRASRLPRPDVPDPAGPSHRPGRIGRICAINNPLIRRWTRAMTRTSPWLRAGPRRPGPGAFRLRRDLPPPLRGREALPQAVQRLPRLRCRRQHPALHGQSLGRPARQQLEERRRPGVDASTRCATGSSARCPATPS